MFGAGEMCISLVCQSARLVYDLDCSSSVLRLVWHGGSVGQHAAASGDSNLNSNSTVLLLLLLNERRLHKERYEKNEVSRCWHLLGHLDLARELDFLSTLSPGINKVLN